jgi:hypothetical protein
MAGAIRVYGVVAVLGLFMAAAVGAAAAQAQGAQPNERPGQADRQADRLAPCLAIVPSGNGEEADVGTCIIEHERLGPLRIGLGEPAAMGAVECPPAKGDESFEEATGSYVQSWIFAECGVTLIMESDERGAAKRVGGITVAAPSRLRTSREVGIGTPEATALAAYEPFLDREMTVPGEVIVAGSPYGGLVMNLENGAVSEIFLGASAE